MIPLAVGSLGAAIGGGLAWLVLKAMFWEVGLIAFIPAAVIVAVGFLAGWYVGGRLEKARTARKLLKLDVELASEGAGAEQE